MSKFFYGKAANLFPMLSGDAYDRLKNDIEKKGILFSIIVRKAVIEGVEKNEIIDGRNRFRAWVDLGRNEDDIPRIDISAIAGENLSEFDIAETANAMRRNLTDSQIAVCLGAIVVERLNHVGRQKKGEGRFQDILAEEYSVSARLIADGIFVVKNADEELLNRVRNGSIALNEAKKIINASLDKESQKELVAIDNKESRKKVIHTKSREKEKLNRSGPAPVKQQKDLNCKSATSPTSSVTIDYTFSPSFVKDMKDVEDSKIDLLLTRFDYKALNTCKLIALQAGRILSSGGAFVALVDNSKLDSFIEAMNADGLQFVSSVTLLMPRKKKSKTNPNLVEGSLTALWYSKRENRFTGIDTLVRLTKDEILDEKESWQESTISLEPLVRLFVSQGDRVCDPRLLDACVAEGTWDCGAEFVGVGNNKRVISACKEFGSPSTETDFENKTFFDLIKEEDENIEAA